MKEGFLIGGGVLFVGLMLQLAVGPVRWDLVAAPVNVILLVLFLLMLGAMYALRHKVYLFEWMMHLQAAVPALCYTLGLTIVMGLVAQTDEGGGIPWLSRMLDFWPFVLTYVWLMVIVGLATLNHLFRFRLQEIPFLLNHLGLFMALVCGALGGADMQRLQMTVRPGAPEWRAQDEAGNMHELDLAVELHAFTIDEYPPKLMLADKTSGRADRAAGAITLEEGVSEGELGDWHIRILQQLPEAAAITGEDGIRYEHWNSVGNTYAVEVEASRGSETVQGWVTCGSYAFPKQALLLDGQQQLIMPARTPRRFASDVTVLTKKGESRDVVIEVNKPFKMAGWKIYQYSYDERLGKWSDISILELIRDPWQPFVLTGILMMLAGALCLFLFMAPRSKKEEETK